MNRMGCWLRAVKPVRFFAALVLLGAPCLEGAVLFSEDFSDNSAGWTLGGEWQIGPAVPNIAAIGFPDPPTDHTPTADNGIAGTVIGEPGSVSTVIGTLSLLTSPAINTDVPGAVTLSFWRWLNSDAQPYVRSSVEVFNGTNWITVFENPVNAVIREGNWRAFSYDVSAYKNANFRVRFRYEVLQAGSDSMSGWNLDDILVESADAAAVPEPSAGLLTSAALAALALRRWRRRAV